MAEESTTRLALPAPEDVKDDDKTTLELNSTIKLDKLGPMIVNSDGTISRISNWQEMSQLERDRTVRILLKRNQIRLDYLGNAQSSESLDKAENKQE
ncbi:SubName: Full=Uncharacterized protein {ECO:0000313/EMBL:CCA74850.1} [Serendipita indica DSM 11827]|uniref:Uncharacterized protein n=1 Tax=Serendipita indica (strain DSM 11827) TaxID=1109443 RepID=G4TU57_SERID|nr:SubName: Full=Uncharacterized protein {ECO:0000313/EMBL:CCA74850.1} [Serendipita indica DSM 11827]CCA74850.1 hypothetical protein PIIN_08819 [Serendipita indica DSM 11827]